MPKANVGIELANFPDYLTSTISLSLFYHHFWSWLYLLKKWTINKFTTSCWLEGVVNHVNHEVQHSSKTRWRYIMFLPLWSDPHFLRGFITACILCWCHAKKCPLLKHCQIVSAYHGSFRYHLHEPRRVTCTKSYLKFFALHVYMPTAIFWHQILQKLGCVCSLYSHRAFRWSRKSTSQTFLQKMDKFSPFFRILTFQQQIWLLRLVISGILCAMLVHDNQQYMCLYTHVHEPLAIVNQRCAQHTSSVSPTCKPYGLRW